MPWRQIKTKRNKRENQNAINRIIYYTIIIMCAWDVTGMNFMAGVGLLSTPYTVKEAGWGSLGVLLVFAVVCYFTAMLMKYCFEKRSTEFKIITFPDLGQAAFGTYGRLLVSVSFFSFLLIFLKVQRP